MIYRNLTYGDLDEDLNILGAFCLAGIVDIISQEEFEDLKVAIKNVMSALKKYKNMYHKEYIHHMDYKEYLRKAEARARDFERKYVKLVEEIASHPWNLINR